VTEIWNEYHHLYD